MRIRFRIHPSACKAAKSPRPYHCEDGFQRTGQRGEPVSRRLGRPARFTHLLESVATLLTWGRRGRSREPCQQHAESLSGSPKGRSPSIFSLLSPKAVFAAIHRCSNPIRGCARNRARPLPPRQVTGNHRVLCFEQRLRRETSAAGGIQASACSRTSKAGASHSTGWTHGNKLASYNCTAAGLLMD